MSVLIISWTERHPDVQAVIVLKESDKALYIKNQDSGHEAWIPKSGLRPYKPPKIVNRVADENEKTVCDWFRARCSMRQMRALGYAE